MKSTINLLSERKVVKKNIRGVFFASVFLFAGSFVIAAAIIVYVFLLQSSISSYDNQAKQIKGSISSLPNQKANALILKERLGSIQKVIMTRKNINATLDSIVNILPAGTLVDSIEGSSEQIAVRVTSSDLLSLNQLVEENIKSFIQKYGTSLSRIEVLSFGIDRKKATYYVALSFRLAK